MKVTLDQNTIQIINMFHNLTGTNVVDCVNEDDCLYFVVAEGQYGLAVGKGGAKIRNAERVFKKPIKVFENAADLEKFVRNVVPEAEGVEIKDKLVFVRVRPQDRARVIGKAGKNVKIMNKFLQRLFDVEEMKVK
jgi:N utilization substance protein A